jgi:Protein of unknown function (DUF4232)
MRLLHGALLGVVVMTSAAACSSGGTSGPTSAQTATSPSASTASTPRTASSAAPVNATTSPARPTGSRTTVTPAGQATCTGADLIVTVGPWNGAGGHGSLPLRFRNTSAAACSITGYPGVAALSTDGREAVQAARTVRGYSGGLPSGAGIPVVSVPPGWTAMAVAEWIETPTTAGATCVSYPAVLVTPPNTTHSTRVSVSHLSVCRDLQVHPVQSAAR